MDRVRSALYLDFDNVFSGLVKLDPKLALRYAEDPQLWLQRLATGSMGEEPRRWLVLRCYLNPAGWVPHPENDGRLYFSRFRSSFTDAGFEVVDCPRLSHTKNGADIRLVIDAVEALRADVRYEEFVIASGDSDMTPLIVRLRASDRRVTVVSPSDSAVVLGAVADRLIGGEELLELLGTPPDEVDAGLDDVADLGLQEPLDDTSEDQGLTADEAKSRFGLIVAEHYAHASEAIYLANLAQLLGKELGPVTSASRWFGYGGFARAVQALNLPGVRMSQHHLWDTRRHPTPAAVEGSHGAPAMPDPVARVTRALRVPSLPRASWPPIFESLATFVNAYEFNLTEATRWSRDQLTAQGVRVNRQAVSIVAHGAAYGGCPLYRQPPPSSGEIASAFVKNVLDRAAAADVDLSANDVQTVRGWFGSP